ncbi:MAG: ABC transporter permease subunit [Spirochaetales bacterium]|nr:ABC transporter permease subunit [Spirochaetales bacterium]
MKSSTIDDKIKYSLCVIFYLLIWQIISMWIGEEILLVSPVKVLIRLSQLILEKEFWKNITFTCLRILSGFFIALAFACILSVLSHNFNSFRIMMKPLVSAIKATPVASIVIVVLIWVSSKNLSIVISFMMAFPILYSSLLSGFDNVDNTLIEMANVFSFTFLKKFKYIYLPSVINSFITSLTTAIGLAWKSGVAAEVIGLPDGSLGERLYEAKTFLMSADIFAITLTVIVVSILIEKAITLFVKAIATRSHLI